MKARILSTVLLVALTVQALVQSSVSEVSIKPLEPIRVKVSGPADSDDYNRELSAKLVKEFGRLRDVVFVSKRPDYTIHFTAAPVDKEQRCGGYGAAVVVVRRKDGNHNLSFYTGATIEELAAFIAETIDDEEFALRRKGEEK